MTHTHKTPLWWGHNNLTSPPSPSSFPTSSSSPSPSFPCTCHLTCACWQRGLRARVHWCTGCRTVAAGTRLWRVRRSKARAATVAGARPSLRSIRDQYRVSILYRSLISFLSWKGRLPSPWKRHKKKFPQKSVSPTDPWSGPDQTWSRTQSPLARCGSRCSPPLIRL